MKTAAHPIAGTALTLRPPYLFIALLLALAVAGTVQAAPTAKLTLVRPVFAGHSVSATLLSAGVTGTPTFAITGQPSQGTVTLDAPATGAFTYTAGPDASGRDSFTFTVTDGTGTSATQTAYLTVQRPGRGLVAAGADTGSGGGGSARPLLRRP